MKKHIHSMKFKTIIASLALIPAAAIAGCEGEKATIPSPDEYIAGNSIWFDTPTSSQMSEPWKIHDFSGSPVNPDREWESRSLPIGNGSLGGSILGSVGRERVVINEKTLWTGGPGTGTEQYWAMNRKVNPATLDSIRQLLAKGDKATAGRMVSAEFRGTVDYDRHRFGTYTEMGELLVNTSIDESAVSDYRRVLNIDKSVALVSFTADSVKYARRYFCSYPDSVMVWRFQSEGGLQNLELSFVTPQTIDKVTAVDGNSLLYQGHLDNNGMQWAMRVEARVNGGGTVKTDADTRTLSVSGTDDVVFLIAGDTDYRMNFDPDPADPKAFVGGDPAVIVNKIIDTASCKSYDKLYADHLADYRSLYDRVKLAINPGEQRPAPLPTDRRLAAYRDSAADHGLEETYFNFGRYLLISSSRPGSMPANLQGIWHNNLDGPWRVDYHNNINVQMNYWPATSTNLLECFVPYIDYIRGLVKPGENTARDYWNARGWTAGISTNIFGFTAPLNSGDMTWNYNPSAGPWLASQIWEYYDYTRDTDWLRETGYPIIKSSADFASDLLYKNGDTYTAAPSYSPEHGQCDLGATYANAVTREILLDAIEAARILDTDQESVKEWQSLLDSIAPYRIGSHGQLQEWSDDIDDPNDLHRHTNHLFGLHPGRSINAMTDTLLANAARQTLRERGDAATGWSMGWKLNHWARLFDGDHAYTLFKNLLRQGTADNLWDVHPPFQIDGNFGGTAGIAELFMQSHTGTINLLPALPSDWADSQIEGLLARGNFEVSVYARGGNLDHALIKSVKGGPCKIAYRGLETSVDTKPGDIVKITADENAGTLTATIGH